MYTAGRGKHMNMIKIELWKQKRTIFILCILFPLLINGLLFVDLQYRYHEYLLLHQSEYGLSNWQLIFKEQTIFYFSELCHVMAATFVYEVFSVELKSNGWMLVVSTSYRRKKVVYGKYVITVLAFFVFFFVDYTSLLIIGKAIGVQGKVEMALFIKSFFIQLVSAAMLTSFYVFIVCFTKRIIYLIPVGCLFVFLNSALYYSDHIQFLPQYPFTYISHGFRASGSELLVSIFVSVLLTILFLKLSNSMLESNRDLYA